jgi:beta-phosphoglucomutase-like phosphatase (HAD superfamily)
MRMVDAVLLEWEGVLADTGAARREALLRALADEGVLWNAAAYEACCGGLDVHAAARAALGSAGRDDATLTDLVALRASRAFVEQLAQGFSLQPGAARFIAAAEHRARVAVVTRAARAETEIVLRLSGLESAIACVVTADDVLALPPTPAIYERALAHLARRRIVPPHRAVALVDTTVAVRAARAAGMRTLAVGAPAHVAMEADAAADSLEGLTLDAAAALVGVAALERPA